MSVIAFLLIMVAVFVVFPICANILIDNYKVLKVPKIGLFSLFVMVMLMLTLSKVELGANISITFDFSAEWFHKNIWFFEKFGIQDALINLAMFTPLGIIVWKKERSIGKNILFAGIAGLIFGLIIETLQFILPVLRTVQIQDILFNTLSSIIGGVVMIIVDCIFGRLKRKKEDLR